MPYAGRSKAQFNLDEQFRDLQLQRDAEARQQDEVERAANEAHSLPLVRGGPHASIDSTTRSGRRHREIDELPSFLHDASKRRSSEDTWEATHKPRAVDLTVPSRSQERLDVPVSVSPGRTPVGSPRRTEAPDWHDAQSSPSLVEPPPPPQRPLLSMSGRNHSAPLIQQLPPVPPPVMVAAVDPLTRGLEAGYALLERLREQDQHDYASNDQQQYEDWCGLRALRSTLKTWGLDNELQRYRPQLHSHLPPASPLLSGETQDLTQQVGARLMQLRWAMQRANGPLVESRSDSPQHEFRAMNSPPLSRNSSNASSSRAPFFSRWPSRRKSNEPVSTRSSASSDSLFSRDSILSSASSAWSSAASASSLQMNDVLLTNKMIDPIMRDLISIEQSAWTFDECAASLPFILLRVETLETWVWYQRLSRQRARHGVAPVGMVPPIDLRPLTQASSLRKS